MRNCVKFLFCIVKYEYSQRVYHMIFSKRRLVFSVSSCRFFRSKVVNLNTRVIPIFNDTAINAEIEQVEILFDCFIISQELSQNADLSHIATTRYITQYITRNSRSRGTYLKKSRRDEVPSVFMSPAEKNGFPFVL